VQAPVPRQRELFHTNKGGGERANNREKEEKEEKEAETHQQASSRHAAEAVQSRTTPYAAANTRAHKKATYRTRKRKRITSDCFLVYSSSRYL
jgi:hypothetical protein